MCWNFYTRNKQMMEKIDNLETKLRKLEYKVKTNTNELTNHLRIANDTDTLSNRSFIYRLEIGGRIVQKGRRLADLTLLNMNLVKYCRYHEWRIISPETKEPKIVKVDLDHYIFEPRDIDYFDGIKDNHLKIVGGMAVANDKVE